MKKLLFILLAISLSFNYIYANGANEVESTKGTDGPIKISMYYSDNATLPFKSDWLTINDAASDSNLDIEWEIIPIADYLTKVSLALNTGTNAPDVILYQTTKGENANLALNGALVPISDYSQWTPNFNKMVEKFGIQEEVNQLKLKDGKRYYMPSLTDVPFYDGGLILREDLLDKYGLEAPTTFDDLYHVLKVFKENNPNSYPLTILAGPRVLYRMTMPSYGISLGKNGASGTNTLSWDYENKVYFEGAISEKYKEYITYFHKLYKEGLLDPEMAEPIDGDRWSQKLVTGKSMASYAYYDQIGGLEAVSEIDGYKLQMYPSLAGIDGAHHQPKSKTGAGIMFPFKTSKRSDFEEIVRAVDNMFFSEKNSKEFCLGKESITYTVNEDGSIKFTNEIVNAKEGIYKYLQLKYGSGSDVTQMVWINQREMTKYDENYSAINKAVEDMGDVIQYIPPTPNFDDMQSEEAGMYQTPLSDTFERWNDAFLTGAKDIEKDWDEYVSTMKKLGIEKFCDLYNSNL